MARLSRIVLPGIPHHVTQRGNGRQAVFFEDGDYELYRDLLGQSAHQARVEIWSYCLMPNHIHAVVVPSDEDGLRATFAQTHRRYTGYINARRRVTGHLWQGRYGSVAMDDEHLSHALRYVALNPVRAGLAERAQDWPWSSAAAHMRGVDDALAPFAPTGDRVGDFAVFLGAAFDEAMSYAALRKAESIGRPIGSKQWLADWEFKTGRPLAAQRRGRPSREPINGR